MWIHLQTSFIKPGLLTLICSFLVVAAACAAPLQVAPATETSLPPTSTAAAPSPTATPAPAAAQVPDILKAYEDAYNRGDANAALALFVDDGLSLIDISFFEAYDKAALRNYLEGESAMGSQVAISDCTLEEEKWRCTLAAHDGCTRAFGVDEWHSDLTVKMKDGRVQVMILAPKPDENKVREDERIKFYQWMEANRHDDWVRLWGKNTSFVSLNRADGELWTEVCQAYIDSNK